MGRHAATSLVARAADALQRGAWTEAEALCHDVLKVRPNDGRALFLLGNARAHAGDTLGAEIYLKRAHAAAPADVAILNSLGGVYGANGKAAEAQAALEKAIAIDPLFPWARQNLGCVFVERGDTARARDHFNAALRNYPNFADALAGLANVAELEHKLDEAETFAVKAARIAPRLAGPRLVLAGLALRRGDAARVIELLRPIIDDTSQRPKNRAAAFALLGQAYEVIGSFERAYAAFVSANDLQRASYRGARSDDSVYSVANMRRLVEFTRSANIECWDEVAPGERDPVFLIGFPRSGTTLLEQILASHPDVDAVEEEEALVASCGALLASDDALGGWARMSGAEIGELRAAYWRKMQAAIGYRSTKHVFVDKLPLNTALLPLIYRVFPHAKIVFAVRDPRDVVVSCFRQNFALNPAMANFLSLEGSVHYYDAVMAVGAVSRSRLPLQIHDVRYERLVADFDSTVRDLLAFLALPWDDAVRKFDQTARLRRVRTPSASRVVKPIDTVAVDRWRGYQRWLAPHLPVLEPWIEALGYRS